MIMLPSGHQIMRIIFCFCLVMLAQPRAILPRFVSIRYTSRKVCAECAVLSYFGLFFVFLLFFCRGFAGFRHWTALQSHPDGVEVSTHSNSLVTNLGCTALGSSSGNIGTLIIRCLTLATSTSKKIALHPQPTGQLSSPLNFMVDKPKAK